MTRKLLQTTVSVHKTYIELGFPQTNYYLKMHSSIIEVSTVIAAKPDNDAETYIMPTKSVITFQIHKPSFENKYHYKNSSNLNQ